MAVLRGRFGIWTMAAAGIVSAVPFLWPSLGFLSWVSFVPVCLCIDCFEKGTKGLFVRLFAFAFSFYACIYDWFLCLYPLDFAGLDNLESAVVIAAALVFIPAIHGALLAALLLVSSRCARIAPRALAPLAPAFFFPLAEAAQSVTWAAFPWARLALTQTGFLPALQSLSLFGPYFLTFLIIAVNALFAAALFHHGHIQGQAGTKDPQNSAIDPGKRRASGFLAAALILFSANLLFGWIRTYQLENRYSQAQTVTAAVIQGNISSYEKWSPDSLEVTSRRYLGLAAQAYGSVIRSGKTLQIMVFPETAIPITLQNDDQGLSVTSQQVKGMLGKIARRTEAVLITGGFYTSGGNHYNGNFAFLPDGTVSRPYAKQHLVPFGEYLPMRPFFELVLPMVADLNTFAQDLTPGEDSALFDLPFGKTGSLVCFDSIFPSLCRKSVEDGAVLMAITTNDSWYKDSRGVYQHNAHAVLRAVENGVSILRAANTGISSVILPNGRVLQSLAPLTQGFLVADVPLREETTLYTTTGDWFLVLCLAVASTGLAAVVWFSLRKKRPAGQE